MNHSHWTKAVICDTSLSPNVMDFYTNQHENLSSSCPGSTVDSDLWMAWHKPTDPFCTDITAIWVFFTDGEPWAHHQGPQQPCSELSHSCLNGILIVSCFCVVVFFLFSLRSVSSLHLRGCLSWHLSHCCQTKSDFFLTNHHSKRWHLEPFVTAGKETSTGECRQ